MAAEQKLSAALGLGDPHLRLEAVLKNASVSIFVMDDRQKCVYMNKAAEDLTGYSLEEVLSADKPLHDIIHHTHPDGRPFPRSECAIDRAFPEHNQVQGEECFVHKDGTFYPVAFTASPIRDEASETIGTIIEVRDTTNEKQAEERQRLLVNELNHRVKNTLATVQAMAMQTFKTIDREALDRFDGRLGVLAKAHNLLTRTSWHKAAVDEIVSSAIQPFGTDRFALVGPACEVHPKAAVSLSMVLHELGTNAIKHGALSSPSGSVSVSWACKHQPEHTELEMTWEERGGAARGVSQKARVRNPSHRTTTEVGVWRKGRVGLRSEWPCLPGAPEHATKSRTNRAAAPSPDRGLSRCQLLIS